MKIQISLHIKNSEEYVGSDMSYAEKITASSSKPRTVDPEEEDPLADRDSPGRTSVLYGDTKSMQKTKIDRKLS